MIALRYCALPRAAAPATRTRSRTVVYASNQHGPGHACPMDRAAHDNRNNQLYPNNPLYQGGGTMYSGAATKADLDNHANQLNPNNTLNQARDCACPDQQVDPDDPYGLAGLFDDDYDPEAPWWPHH